MNSVPSRSFAQPVTAISYLILATTIALASVLITGCGGQVSSQPPGSNPSGNTSVTILATSTANNKISKFILEIESITLTTSDGNAVTVIATPLTAEFIHVNGTAEPLATLSIPQGTYTSATASIGGASFTCVTLNPSTGGLVTNQMAYGYTLPSQVSVYLPTQITVAGAAMGLSLDLLVPKSADYASCDAGANSAYSITPTFNLTTLNLSSQPTNDKNGKVTDLLGSVASVDANGSGLSVNAVGTYFGETPAGGPAWQVTTSDSTLYQGISGPSQLTTGMPMDMDAIVQENGSLLATRIAVYDTNTANLTFSRGPLLYQNEYEPMLVTFGVEGQGHLSGLNAAYYDFNNAVFQASGQLANVGRLPFTASFTALNMVAGQKALISTHALSVPGTFPYTQAATITLMPQTINGTVSAISSQGGFATYTVTLADYDLFPNLAVQPGQATLLANPNTVVAYADSNTQMVNSNPIVVGSVMRFYGLVFNDNGALRMDCAQISDGVPE